MKIDSSFKPTTPPPAARTAQPQANTSAVAQEAVSFSPLASSILQTGEKPPVNSARISEIKQAIADGKFKINPEAIANRLIETAQDLLNSKNKRQA